MTEPRHHLFHALVLMGGTLALGCGGIVGQSNGDGSASNGAGGAPDSFGPGGNYGVAGSPVFTANGGSGGGFFVASAGGSGGLSIIQTGVGGEGPVFDGGSPADLLPCVPAQWNCSGAQLVCDYLAGYTVQGSYGCVCDGTRPSSAEDCAPGESFVCEQGAFESDGITVQVPFECSCVPGATDCSACEEAFGQFAECSISPASILCGCAVVSLQ